MKINITKRKHTTCKTKIKMKRLNKNENENVINHALKYCQNVSKCVNILSKCVILLSKCTKIFDLIKTNALARGAEIVAETGGG